MIKPESDAQKMLRILAQKTFEDVEDFLNRLSNTMLPTNSTHDEYMEAVKILQTIRVPTMNTLGWTLEEFESERKKRDDVC